MRSYLLKAILVFVPGFLHAVPVELARESFEGAGGAIGFTTSVPQFDETTLAVNDFFSIQPNNGTKLIGGTITGGDGPNMFAAEDIDTNPGPLVGPTQFLTTNAFNITGKSSTSVKLLLAAPGNGPAAPNSQSFYDNATTPTDIDFVRVEASVDGGPFNRLIQFSPTVPASISLNSPLGLDSDADGLADPSTTNLLTSAFREFNLPFATGSTVQIRVVMHSNATNEYICVDNIRIFGENSATAAPVLAGVPPANLVFTEGGAATPIAPAITVTDADSANLTSATVSISQNYVTGQDVLSATPSGAIVAGDIVFNAANGTLTITRNTTKAAYQTVLRSVSYRNTNTTAPSTAVRRVTFQTTDGTNASNSPSRDINVVDAIVTQAIPFVESWETDGVGTRYAVEGGFSSPPSMFARFQPSGVTGIDGTSAWGVENVDNNADMTESVTFNLNAAGLVNLTGELRVAAGGGAIYDGGPTPDFLRVEVSADGGAFQNVLAFYSDTEAQGSLRQDTTPGDATNLGNGTQLTAALQTFGFTLPTGNILTVRIRAFTNIAAENILFDRLFVNGFLPPLIVTTAADNVPGSLRATVAAALTQPGLSTIHFDPAVFNGEAADVITLTSPEIAISDADGVIIDASLLPRGVTISGSNARRIFNVAATGVITLQGLTLTGGNSTDGGAIRSVGNLTLKSCTLMGNTSSGAGGAIASYNATSRLLLENCTLTGNTAGFGGALRTNGSPWTLLHCTIASNTSPNGTGGIVTEGSTGTLTNCLIAGNLTTNGDKDIGGAGTVVTRAGSNLIGVPAGQYPAFTAAGLPNANGDFVGTLAVPLVPRLGLLMNNGGPTATMHPLPGSLARDRIASTSVTTDQRGATRGQWGMSDIGAVEAGIQADCAWEVRDVFTSPVTTLQNLTNVDAMLANPAATQVIGVVPVINFNDLNGQVGGGFFAGDNIFLCDNLTPQGLNNQDDDRFATQARAYLTITVAGDYTFGFASDDGARLRLYSTTGGANPVFTSSTRLNTNNPANPAHTGNSLTFDAPTGNSDTLGVVNLAPGVYGVEFTMWEDGGGASGEVFFATGAQTATGSAFSLLGGDKLARTPGVSRPLNDDFANALPLSGGVVHTASCNAGATIEPGEPTSIPSNVNPRGKSVWWTWTAPTTGGYQVDTSGSNFDTVLAVLTGSSVGGLTELAVNDDTGDLSSRVLFGATAGTVYRIQVSGFGASEGHILLNIGPAANQVPSFAVGANQNVFTNAGTVTVPGWATAINPGAAWESGQVLDFIVTATNTSLYLVQPAVLPDGTLTYTPAPGNGGSSTVSISLHDNGGTANGGVNTSAAQGFTITTSLSPTTGTTLTINAGGTGSGTASIAQNFNTVSASSVPWVDNSTVPGWYAQINDGNTPSGTFQPSNGATALNGLINCGSTGTPADRALGSKPTSTGNIANISYAVVIRNVGSLPVKLSRIRYAEELWRSGAGASMQEKVTTFYAISNSPLASIASGPSAAVAAPGAGFTAMPAGANTQISHAVINTALDGNVTANRSTVDFTPVAADMPAIFPGQYITVKWTDTNEVSFADGHQAIDDVTLDFTELPCALLAVVTNVVRHYGNGSSDTVDFTLNTVRVGSGASTSFVVTAPAAFSNEGTYGSPLAFTGRPLSDFTPAPVLNIVDGLDVNCTTTVTVPLPLTLGYNFLTTPISYIQAGGTSPASVLLRQTAPNDLTFDPGSAVQLTDPIFLTPGTEKCLTLQVEVTDTSTTSGFEALDTMKVELLCTTPAGIEIETLTDDYDINRDGVMSGGATPLADEFNLEQKANATNWASTFLFVGTVPANATSCWLRISATINGQPTPPITEVYRFRFAYLRECVDADGDGYSDAWEAALGTDVSQAASFFQQNSITANGTNITLPVRTDNTTTRTYQLISSPNLINWTRDGLPTTVNGLPSGWPLLQLTRPRTGPRNFYKVLVQQPQVVIP